MNINFEYYKIFYYVSRYKNFTLAARALSTSQPSITRSIKNLEYHLGCRLFIRSTKGVSLTPEGEILYRHVSPACELIFKGEETLGNAMSLQSGSVYIGATETAIHCFLLEKLEEFHRTYPHVGIKITNASTPPILNDLKSGRIDLGIVTTPVLADKRFKVMKIKKFQDVLIGGLHLAHLSGKILKLSELGQYPLVCLSESTMTYQFYSEFYVKNGLSFHPDIELATADLLLPMIQKNLGIGFVPEELAAKEIKQGGVVRLELEEQIPERYICVIRDLQNPLSAAAKQIVKLLTEK